MAPPYSPAPSTVSETMLKVIFQAASDDDLPLFKELVSMLDEDRVRQKEAIEALRWEDVEELEGLGVLHAAASKGSLEVCRYLVEELQVDVNGVDKEGRTPLLFAILCKGVGIAKYLLDHGADPDKASHDGFSPLHPAAGSGDCETVELLLAKGAYVDPVAFCGTPLHCAASGDNYSTMKILLDHDADCNKMVNGKTPLVAAIDADSRNCMLLLIRAGADRKGALTYALENLHSENLVSADFANCVIEDVAANHVVPDAGTKIPDVTLARRESSRQSNVLKLSRGSTLSPQFGNNPPAAQPSSLTKLVLGRAVELNRHRRMAVLGSDDWSES